MSKGGFDPDRVGDVSRERPIIPQILSSDTAKLAKGFTEIKVVGLGGSGNNTVDRMIETGVQGIDFIAVNSDIQALDRSLARKRLQIGEKLTRGLGTGGDPKLGERAAEAAQDALHEALAGADMVFVTAGLGGGTGTGAAPTVANVARNAGALTVGVVTLPFAFEGVQRKAVAQEGLARLRPLVDSMIVVSNDRLLQLAPTERLHIQDTFKLADETLHHGIQGVADLVITSGLINLDFADVHSVMHRAGPAMMAIGSASGQERAIRAVQTAISSPLLEASIEGAHGVLLNVTGGPDMTLFEVNEAASAIAAAVSPDCNIIFGAAINPRIGDEIRITVIATGFDRG